MSFPVFVLGDKWEPTDANAVGLWLVKSFTVSAANANQDVTACFSSDYSNYRIEIDGLTTSAIIGLQMQFLVGSTPTATGYYWSGLEVTTAGAVTGSGGANVTGGTLQIIGFTNPAGGVIEVWGPNKAARTSYNSGGVDMRTAGTSPYRAATGFQDSNTQFTGFRLLTGGATTITGGTIRVYGYRN